MKYPSSAMYHRKLYPSIDVAIFHASSAWGLYKVLWNLTMTGNIMTLLGALYRHLKIYHSSFKCAMPCTTNNKTSVNQDTYEFHVYRNTRLIIKVS